MVVTLVARTDSRTTGIGRYTYSIYDAFRDAGRSVSLVPPTVPKLFGPFYDRLRMLGVDFETFFKNYPVAVDVQGADICHLTSQNIATLLCFNRLPPAIVSVLDLHILIKYAATLQQGGQEGMRIPKPHNAPLQRFRFMDHLVPTMLYYAMHGQGSTAAQVLFDRVAMLGVMQARAIITISAYTKQTVVDLLGYPEEDITVVYPVVNTDVFRPLPVPADFRARYNIPDYARMVLFVGSEDPRKNVPTLIQAFHLLAAAPHLSDLVLVKAGAIHFHDESKRLRQMVSDYGLQSRVMFITDVSDADLPLLYNTADVFVTPSLFEGFGLPALEAMACGKPVIAADATSLPEVVGDVGILFDPYRADDLAVAIVKLLDYPEHQRRLGEQGVARAQYFSPARQAEETWDVYRRVYEQGVRG